MKVAFTLSFSSSEWICFNEDVSFSASSLEAIDEKLENFLTANYPSGEYKVNMYFDFDRFPLWHRQYMPHYFNRELIFHVN